MRAALLALAIGIIVVVGAALQFGMPGGEKPTPPAASGKSPVGSAPPPAVAVPPPRGTPVLVVPDFASLAERLSPVVVNISSRSQRKEQPDTPRFRGP